MTGITPAGAGKNAFVSPNRIPGVGLMADAVMMGVAHGKRPVL